MKPVILPTEHSLGNHKGMLQVICYGDYLCPASRKQHLQISHLLEAYEGEFVYTFRPFPQPHRYPYSLLAARAVEAAGRQDHYRSMHYALFRYYKRIDLDALCDIVYTLRLDPERFHKDLQDPMLLKQLLIKVEEAQSSGVRATPALFVNGVLQQSNNLGRLHSRLENRSNAVLKGKVIGTVDPLLGSVYWGQWPGL